MSISEFEFSFVHKVPSNTIGVHSEFYYGAIDGVEVGKPCNTIAEAEANLAALLTPSETHLEELLTESVEWLELAVNRVDGERRASLNMQLAKEQHLLAKLIAFKRNSH